MNPYEQYVQPYLPSEGSRARVILYVLGGVAGVLFVWWFIQVVIGRNFKNAGSEYIDNSGGGSGNSGGSNPWTGQNNGSGNGTPLVPTLEKLTQQLYNANQLSWLKSKTAQYVCYTSPLVLTGQCDIFSKNEAAVVKVYWDFLGISEGLLGQQSVAKRYKEKFGTELKKDFETPKGLMNTEQAQRVEAVLAMT